VYPRDKAAEEPEVEPKRLGLIAGSGRLPIEAARLVRSLGYSIHVLGFEGLCDASIASLVTEARFLRLGQLEAMAAALNEMGIRQLLLVGKVPKSILLMGETMTELDAEAIRLLAEASERGDEPLMQHFAQWLSGRNFVLCDQSEWLAPMLAPAGSLSARMPSALEFSDFEVGQAVVEQLGHSGVGQCVIVKQGSVLALEAIDGTDATIRRGGALGGRGCCVIKAARPGQDRRFDLPAVGVETIETMIESGATALAVEADSTLLIDREGLRKAADRSKIAVWGFSMQNPMARPSP
jgi:DUF1009 family protein